MTAPTTIYLAPTSPTSSAKRSTARPAKAAGFRLTERDIRLVYAVYAHRALTSLQIAQLHFPSGNRKDPIGPQCRRRLKYLCEQGFLERVEQPVALIEGRKPYIYFLDGDGVDLLVAELGIEPETIDWKKSYNSVKWPFLDHLLKTNDVRIAIELAAPRMGLELEEWLDDRVLSSPAMKDEVTIPGASGRRERAAVIPDGYFSLRADQQRFRAFVEADRSTVTLTSDKPYRRTWARKVQVYLTYFKTEKFYTRYQARKPFRVLTVTETAERAAHMKAVTEAAGGGALFWFTTYDLLTEQSALFSPIWSVAGSGEPACFPFNPS